MFLGQRRLWERIASVWWVMALPSATAHLNSPIITLVVGACGEESALMNPIPAELTGFPRFSSLALLEAAFYPLLPLPPHHGVFLPLILFSPPSFIQLSCL